MPTYLVTERQILRYTWEVEAGSIDEAIDSANDGVPASARSRLVESDTVAELIDPATGAPLGN